MSWQLKRDEQKRTINAINTGNKETYNPTEINDAFKQYYSELYTSQTGTDHSQMNAFLSSVHLPCLSEEDMISLDLPFSAPELIKAIHLLPNNKSPGEDGFPSEFYKEFKDLLVPYLMEVLEQSRADKCFPESFSNAIISVIYKKGKDPLNCASYRPISLLNVDYKLVTKMIAKRLETRIPLLINPDQTGFVIERISSNYFFILSI